MTAQHPTAQVIYVEAEAVRAGADPATAAGRIASHLHGSEPINTDTLGAAQILDSGATFLRAVNDRQPDPRFAKAADELASAVDLIADGGIVPRQWYFGWLRWFAAPVKATPTAQAPLAAPASADEIAAALVDRLAQAIEVRITSMPRTVRQSRVLRDAAGRIDRTISVEEDAATAELVP